MSEFLSKALTSIVFAYPNLSITKTTSCSTIGFSTYTASLPSTITVFRGTAYSFFIFNNSFFITFAMALRSDNISSYSAILPRISSYSFCNARISRPISLYKRKSSIACACFSEKFRLLAYSSDSLLLNFILSVIPFIRQFLASLRLLLPRSISIIRSIISHALIRPSLISFCSISLLRSVVYFLVFISY